LANLNLFFPKSESPNNWKECSQITADISSPEIGTPALLPRQHETLLWLLFI